ncbi:MAG: TIGR03618 family F420-dependent PPOX class oxidoreductase [Dehalococcoidia bacterium]
MSMNSGELAGFLERGRMGVVATIRVDGSPQVTPVWYRYDGEAIIIWTARNRIWVKNAQRDNRVAFSVHEETPPFAAVVIRGRAEVANGPDETGLAEAKIISRRYIEEGEVEGYVERWWPGTHDFVRITPEAVTSWRQGY